MKVLPLAIIDSLFTAFLGFFIAFLVLNFYLSFPLSLILAIVISLPVLIFSFYKIKKDRTLFYTKKQTQKQIESTACALCFLDRTKLLSVFKDALTKKGYDVTLRKNSIIIDSEKAFIRPIFCFDKITKTDIVKAYNCIEKEQTAYLFGTTISDEIATFIARFNGKVVFIDQEKVYNLLNSTDCLPKDDCPIIDNKKKRIKLLSNLINRTNSKKFLLFGFLFVLMSYFAPLRLYYIIIGTIFLFFALLLRLFAKKAPKQTT